MQSRHEKQFNNQYKSKNECKKQTEKKESKTKEIKQSKTTPNRKPVSCEALFALAPFEPLSQQKKQKNPVGTVL